MEAHREVGAVCATPRRACALRDILAVDCVHRQGPMRACNGDAGRHGHRAAGPGASGRGEGLWWRPVRLPDVVTLWRRTDRTAVIHHIFDTLGGG